MSERITAEVWKIDCGCPCKCGATTPREVHVFVEGDQRGQAYVLGFNPGTFPEEDIRSFLRRFGVDWPGRQ